MILKYGDDVVEALNDGPVHPHAHARGRHLTLRGSAHGRRKNIIVKKEIPCSSVE